MTAVPTNRLTPAEYLAIERQAAFKSEFFSGEMFAMADASREHNLIVGNLVRELGLQLKDRQCEVYPSDMRVRLPSGLYTYPNVSVVCGPPQFEDAESIHCEISAAEIYRKVEFPPAKEDKLR